MKEFSIEEKAKAYDRALEIAKAWCKLDNNDLSNDDLETLFPEIRESEDERIRRELINYFKWQNRQKPLRKDTHNKWIAWLEKLGEQKVSYTTIVETGNGGINALVTRELPTDGCDEQKPADKVEPKFKVGDWIIFNGLTLYINEVVEGYYRTISIGGIPNSYDWNIDNVARLWTIQDTKDGDVLSNEKMIVIFKHFEEPSYRQHIVAYIGLDRGGDIQITDDTWRLGIDKAKPATKEQRDLLFQKMHEFGYEWDTENKELKKIDARKNLTLDDDLMQADCMIVEQKPAWSEEDEDMIQVLNACVDAVIKDGMNYISFGSKSILIGKVKNWLKSLKLRCAWRPSDEQMRALENFIGTIPPYERMFQILKSLYNELKKLKRD